uniref:F-box domain-containing protein n=1 Tax=Chenopodium quinoa TaxID=63459 RepID=A0A803L9M1_CHEQI
MLVDRLSSLPDELLIRILSLLPTKDAAATCALSTKLRRVFPLITSLDFDGSPICLCLKHPYAIERFPTFVSFVDTVLQTHESQHLTKFKLKLTSKDFGKVYFFGCDSCYGCSQGCLPDLRSPRLNVWISYPLSFCGLRELDLSILVGESGNFQLPPAIFTCETLEVLKLEVNIGFDQIYAMPSYCLPKLKQLVLFASLISEDDFLPRLVSSCPLLEDLTFQPFTRHVNITATSLRRLTLRMPKGPDFFRDNSDCVLINTPNLEYIEYSDNLASCYSIPVMHGLVKASLTEFDFIDEEVLKDKLPVFPNLKHLELGGATEDSCWDNLLLPFLNCSPVLETLEFAQGLAGYHGGTLCEYRKKALEQEREFFTRTDHETPVCCRNRLKRIVIREYHGFVQEILITQFLLRHALVLEELVICLARTPNFNPCQMLIEVILKNLPKASVTCSIQVL